MSSFLKYLYNKFQTGCSSAEVIKTVENHKEEIKHIVSEETQKTVQLIATRNRAYSIYEEYKTEINTGIDVLGSKAVDKALDVLQPVVPNKPESIEPPVQEETINLPTLEKEERISDDNLPIPPPPSPEQTVVIAVEDVQ